MNEEQLRKQTEKPILKDSKGNPSEGKRRRLLKGAVAIPVIMTLHSGAALARTSNLIGEVGIDDDVARNEHGDLYCLNHEGQPDGSKYDLGENPTATLVDRDLELADQADECKKRGGIMVSSTAFNSISARVPILPPTI